MTKDEQVSLLKKLSDPEFRKELLESLDKKLSSKKFWEEDEKRYIALQKKLKEEHDSIKMSYEKLHTPFTI